MEFTPDILSRLAQADKIAYNPRPRDFLRRAPTRGLLVITDGITPQAMERAHTPTFDALAARGVKAERARTIFPTITGPAHTSLLTGARVRTHGFLYPKILDAYGNRLVDFAEGRVRAETIAEAWRENGITSVGIGSRYLRGADAMISEGVLGEDFAAITERALDALRTWAPHLLMIVFYVGDTFAHLFGPEADETLATIEQMDAMTQRILDAYQDQNLLDETLVAVLADHGHARVDGVVPSDFAERAGALPHGRLALAPREFGHDTLRALLNDPRVEDVYARDELALLGAWDDRWGERVVMLKEGLMFPDARGRTMRGYHGGFADAEWHIPLILNGPGIAAGARLEECEIVDLAPTFSTLLGGTLPAQNEGRVLWEILDTTRTHSVEGYVRLWRETYTLLVRWRDAKRAWARGEMDDAAFERGRLEFRERVSAHAAALKRARDELSGEGS
jgi:arylsulfatase A-like enzyme